MDESMREELARAIAGVLDSTPPGTSEAGAEPAAQDYVLADELIAQGWRKARVEWGVRSLYSGIVTRYTTEAHAREDAAQLGSEGQVRGVVVHRLGIDGMEWREA